MTNIDELVEILARRHEILRALSVTPRERHELVEELDDAKSTVYKGVSQLLEMELIRPTTDGLRPTMFGSVALRRYEELERTAELRSFLGDLPPDAIDPVVFVGCEFVRPDTGSVGRHLERTHQLLKTARDVRGVVPAASTENVEVVRERVNDGKLSAEFVLAGELADSLLRERPAVVESLLDNGAVLWRTDNSVPFAVFVVRDGEASRMGIEFRDENLVTGLLLNDTADSIDWAEQQIARFKTDTERVVRDA
jgi:predicted transcriptional regulator